MQQQTPTVRARELGLALRRAIDATGLQHWQVADRLGYSPTWLSNRFSGRRHTTEIDTAAILAICGIKGPAKERLLRLARESHDPGWWQDFDDRLPAELRTLIDYEDSAITITSFETTLLPGLLQIPDYTRAVLQGCANLPEQEIDDRVKARIRRQEIFNRLYRPRFRFFLDEYVLARSGLGREVMSEQVHHLLRMSVRPYVEIRVIPDAAGFHANHAFHLMEFTELHPVVHVEDETSVLFLERTSTTDAYRDIVATLAHIALTEGQSKEWISSLASQLGEPRKDDDDLAEEFIQRSE